LAEHLLRRFRPAARSERSWFAPATLELLQSHVWPGNVRDLANVIEHATILCETPPITPDHLPSRFVARKLHAPQLKYFGPMSLREIELHAIQAALQRHSGSKPRAAEELGVSLKTLYNKLHQADSLERKSA
jgi:two-component system NtrC family response regulator